MFTKNIVILFLLIFSNPVFAQSAWGEEVFLDVQEKSLRFVLEEIRMQTKLNLIFDDNQINNKLLSCNITAPAEKILKDLLSDHGLDFKKFSQNTAVIFKDKSPSKKRKAVVSNPKPISKPKYTLDNIISPILLNKEKLTYPLAAVKDRLEGDVTLRVLVSRKGNVLDAVIEKSSGHDILDSAAVRNMKDLKFLAAELNGKYEKIWTSLKIKFNYE